MSKEVGEMVQSRDVVQAEGSARTEGARRATGVPADVAAAGAGSLAPGQRWSASRKRDVVLRLLRGESLEALSREVGVEIYRLDAWRARAMAGLELGLKARHGEPVAEVLDAAKRHIGELSMEIELLRERARARGAAPPFGDAEVATMSATTSAATGRCFGIQRVCQVLALRSTRGGRGHTTIGWARGRRGGGRRRGNRTRTDRSRAVPVPRRRSQGASAGWDPSVLRSCGRTDCSPRTAGVRAPDPRREGHHCPT